MATKKGWFLTVFAALLWAESAFSGTLTLPPYSDTYIANDAPTTNYGDLYSMQISDDNSPASIKRMLIRFYFSGLPAGASIQSATLTLRNRTVFEGPGYVVQACRLTQTSWDELDATWNVYGTGSWTTAGGDYTTTDAATDTIVTTPTELEFDVTNLAIYAQNNTSNFLNLLIKYETEDQSTSYKTAGYQTRENGSANAPVLVIVYTAWSHTLNTVPGQNIGSFNTVENFTAINTIE